MRQYETADSKSQYTFIGKQAMHNPIQAFKTHWNLAKTQNDPNTSFCTLTTVSETGDPPA